MPKIQPNREIHRPTRAGLMRGNEHGELPVDDPPPADHPSENYSAWKASAIFEFVPFSAPGSR
jgi:hypothetical protein